MVPTAIAAMLLAGCHPASRSKPAGQLTPAELRGQQIVQTHCRGCHSVTSKKTLVGPGLQGLFQQPYLPSGAPATDGFVRSRIIRGGDGMPAFGNSLDDNQIRDVVAYLHTV
jgi:mono/diheme cytochrome c family protein